MATTVPPQRARKKLSRQSWLFLLLGLPLFIFLLMLINGYQVVNGLIFILTTIGLFLATVRRKNFGIRFTRATFFSVIVAFFTIAALVENPGLWPSQIYRHAFKSTLIQPDNAKIVEVNDAFEWWLDNRSTSFGNGLTYYGNNLTDTSKPMEDVYYNYYDLSFSPAELSLAHFSSNDYYTEFQKLMIVDYFIRSSIMQWTSDTVTWDVSDHVPVPDEALSRWSFSEAWKKDPTNSSLQAWDDCDGIAVVTVSFLRRLLNQNNITGQSYIACGAGHWFTAVAINQTTPVVFLNHWYSIHVYGIFGDNGLATYGQNVIATLQAGLIVDGEALAEFHQYLDVIMARYFWAIVIGAFVISALATLMFGYPRDYDTAGEKKFVADRMNRVKTPSGSSPKLPAIFLPFAWFWAKIGNPFAKRHLFFWLNTILMAGLLLIGVSTLYFGIINTTLFPYATIFMYACIFVLLFVLDRDFMAKGFKIIYKLVKKRDFLLYGR
nr:hypothetical protein [Candidatus Sigynarchaeota archaeon]